MGLLIIRMFVFLAFAIWVPLSAGMILEYIDKRKTYLWREKLLYGFCGQLILAQILGMLCVLTNLSFHIFAVLYLGCVLIIVIIGTVIWCQLLPMKGNSWKFHVNLSLGKLISGIIIMWQVIWLVLHQTALIADGTIEEIVTLFSSNSIHQINPFTGALSSDPIYINLTGFYPEYLAVWIKLMNITPSVFCQMVLPMVYIPYGYSMYALWKRRLFPNNAKLQDIFFLFCCILNLYGCYSIYSNSSLLLLYPWTTNNILVNIIIPLLLYNLLDKEQSIYRKIVLILVAIVTTASLGALKVSAVILTIVIWLAILLCRRYIRIERNP